MYQTVKITKSNREDKRFRAVFSGNGSKTVHFGSKNGKTFIDHQDRTKRRNYIKRHGALAEDWSVPDTAGSLSRWILWEKPDLNSAIENFANKFGLKYKR